VVVEAAGLRIEVEAVDFWSGGRHLRVGDRADGIGCCRLRRSAKLAG
jgi:hypothetical protein